MTKCPNCEVRPFTASLKEPDGPEGFVALPHFAGYIRRCLPCSIQHKDEERAAEAFFRAPTPEELAANEKFAAEFMGRVIPGITCGLPQHSHVDTLLLEQPWRTVLITGFEGNQPTRDALIPSILACPKCGARNCTKNHPEFT